MNMLIYTSSESLIGCGYSLGPLESRHYREVVGIADVLGVGDCLAGTILGIAAGIRSVRILDHHSRVGNILGALPEIVHIILMGGRLQLNLCTRNIDVPDLINYLTLLIVRADYIILIVPREREPGH